ncbi:MAG: MFS transporter [Gammaproteobacteria bacterium]|nr:MFS transporter [Gammaproteobacteria bacterium]MCW8957866.1 MFS transporter [Gammaproteobacteria bacterium]MCW8973750.1 MFS transporter [Gammaproteobacteria bacterium]MCW8993023.1 MFS transporter [Gammaproteobacteria bacterium]MCW9088230.1 MFS transporter [Gammaproteobacteria bacterium]
MSSPFMTPLERRAAFSLAGIFSLRMLGLFMILPVFALYAEQLRGVTPLQVGLAIGIYGLTQALLQIPFGMLSDRIGRKPVIAGGLLLFALGSLVAALATTIEGVILGRALQGAGAIAAAIMALTADLTKEEHRSKAMAVIGLSIGLSFMVAMAAGPLLNQWVGVPGIFALTAVLALLGVVVLYTLVPTPTRSVFHRDAEVEPAQFRQVLRDPQLLRLDGGIMVLHLALTASFVVLPLVLVQSGFEADEHWRLYLPVMLLGMALIIPFIIIAEKKRRMKAVFSGAVALLLLAQLGLIWGQDNFWAIALMLQLFFLAFNLLEATLPSLVSKIAPPQSKGTAMGVYTSSQFIGAFIGGAAGGWVHGQFGTEAVFAFSALLIALWWLAAVTMREPPYLTTEMFSVEVADELAAKLMEEELRGLRGVAEVSVNVDDGVAYLKVDRQMLDTEALKQFQQAVPEPVSQ